MMRSFGLPDVEVDTRIAYAPMMPSLCTCNAVLLCISWDDSPLSEVLARRLGAPGGGLTVEASGLVNVDRSR